MLSRALHAVLPVVRLLPGFLLWASFPPMGETADALFALAPLMWFSRTAAPKASAKRWFANGFLFWFATLSWMPAIVKNGGPWPLVVLGWAGLAAYCSVYFAAYGYLSAAFWAWSKSPRHAHPYLLRLLGLLVVEPVLWCGFELIRSRFLGGFAWNQLGVAAVNAGFGAPAALGGVYLCSAAVLLVNGTIASIAERVTPSVAALFRRPGPVRPVVVPNWVRSVETFLPALVIYAVYSLAAAFPVLQASGPRDSSPDRLPGHLSVALIQRNFPCVFMTGEEEGSPVGIYEGLAEHIAPLKPDLVILPESAYSEVGRIGTASALRFSSWLAEKCGAKAVLAGGSRLEEGREYNSAALYGGEELLAVYDKVHLVPFGEFIPGDKLFPALQRFAPVGSCTPGALELLSLAPGGSSPADRLPPLGVAICFEDTDSAQMRELAARGAAALVFITNDSWFSRSVEALQHAWQARARAIETGLPVVRVGNSGVSGTISPDGRASWLVDGKGRPLVDRRGTMFDRLETAPAGTVTVYTRLGDRPLALVFSLLILTIIMVKYKHEREQRRFLPV